jgi:hypothetical protein
VAGLAEDGGERGKRKVGFRGIPIGREDQHDLHLPAAGGFKLLAIEEDQFLGGPFTLGILDFHRRLILRSPDREAREIVRMPIGYNENVFYEGGSLICKGEKEWEWPLAESSL